MMLDSKNLTLIIDDKIIPLNGFTSSKAVDNPDNLLHNKVADDKTVNIKIRNLGVKKLIEKFKLKNPKLGFIKNFMFNIDLISENVIQARPYNVPESQKEMLKDELNRLIEL
ncbi:hypothetical protein A0H76_2548 [Hepatospora eriocheir]|uniref:Uncharacterized protein n=1 Tax=Hepatospora eriocheir TaxID=1081669 RepID=A0A1X0QJP0_9MICR|nr:hypothetical protein A0H76_2548 [Hepatospora eriocheir]